jgi:hypothetical protein
MDIVIVTWMKNSRCPYWGLITTLSINDAQHKGLNSMNNAEHYDTEHKGPNSDPQHK